MCETHGSPRQTAMKTIPVENSVGMVLAHDITEIRPEEFKGRAFRKGHVIRKEDICHLQRLGKERLYILEIAPDEMHEDEAAHTLAGALMGEGLEMQGPPKEGKINIIASRDGLLKVNRDGLAAFNMLGEVMCATLHDNTMVRKRQVIAGTRAIPLVVRRGLVAEAVSCARHFQPVLSVKEMIKPRAGLVITGNEVYYGRIKDAFAPVIRRKVEALGGEMVGQYFAPDNENYIKDRLSELLDAGAEILVTTGGMSVDPDDVTRHAIRSLGSGEITYGSAVLPGAMFLLAYISYNGREVPVLGVPACGMYHGTTVFDLVLPRVLAGERMGRRELAEMGHGGLCMGCKECRYPVCPFGK